MAYEALLLFGVLFIAVLLFTTLMQQHPALDVRQALQYCLFVVVGFYFVWFWSHGGQTLAMKTWRIKLVTKDGSPLKIRRAIYRYVLAWLWFAPGLALAGILGAKTWMLVLIPAANMLVWALAIYLDPHRQFLHDRFAGTRLVNVAVQRAAKS